MPRPLPSAAPPARPASPTRAAWEGLRELVDDALLPLTLRRLGFARGAGAWRGSVAGAVVEVAPAPGRRLGVRLEGARGPTAPGWALAAAPGPPPPGAATTGDPRLDAVGRLDLRAPAARAALDEGTRALLVELLTAGASVRGGAIALPARLGRSPGALAQALSAGGRLLRQLSGPRDAPVDALLRRVHGDREPGVRLACMEALLDLAPGSPQARAAVRVWRQSRDPALRVVSAKAAGRAGLGTLLSLADPEHGPLPAHARAQALAALVPFAGRAAPHGGARGLQVDELRRALGAIATRALTACPQEAVQAAACRLAGVAGAPEAVPALSAALMGGRPDIAAEAARALGCVGDREAEAALLDALRGGPGSLRGPALQALTACGGPRSLAPLLELASWGPGSRGFAAWRLRGRAATAFWRVARRAAQGASGRLSPAWAGATQADRGALSLTGSGSTVG